MAYLVESPELACSFDTGAHGSTYLILVIASVVVILIYFFGVQYALSLTAQHGDEKLRKAIAGNFKKGWHRWFIVTNTFKTGIVVISLFVRDPTTQGVLALVLVSIMLLATRNILPYEYILTAE